MKLKSIEEVAGHINIQHLQIVKEITPSRTKLHQVAHLVFYNSMGFERKEFNKDSEGLVDPVCKHIQC